MRQGGVLDVGVIPFDDGVAAVGLVGGDGVEVGGGEERVKAPGVEQGGLPVVAAVVEVRHAAYDQPARTCSWPFWSERGEFDPATSAREIHR